jgi:adenylate cyclase
MGAAGKRPASAKTRLLRATPLALASRLLDLGAAQVRILERFAQRGSITILFTDIVDFTATTEAGGEQAALGLLDAHDSIVIPEIQRHGGRVVKSMGDGVMAVFGDPSSAVSATVGMLRDARPHANGRRPMRMRIGLDAGRPTKRGGDYIGHTVNVAARLVKRARPGEALVTDAVRRGAGELEDAVWHERGRPTLKGVQKPPETWRLRAAPSRPAAKTKARSR